MRDKAVLSLLLVWISAILYCDRAYTEELKEYQAKVVSSPPVIDGKCNDICWQNAKKSGEFNQVITGRGPAKEQTVFAVCCDSENIYFSIVCFESKIRSLKKTVKNYDGSFWQKGDDCIEIYLDANLDRNTYYHFLVNPLGTRADARKTDSKWNGAWQAQTNITSTSWTVEIAIPFKTLGIKGRAGELIGLNITRARRSQKDEFSCWSTIGGGFHAPEGFGYLVIGDYAAFINMSYLPKIKALKKQIDVLLAGNVRIADKYQKKAFRQFDGLIKRAKTLLKAEGAITARQITALLNEAERFERQKYIIKLDVLTDK